MLIMGAVKITRNFVTIFLFCTVLSSVFSIILSFRVQPGLKSNSSENLNLEIGSPSTPECDCGANSISCFLLNGEKNCTCQDGYSQKIYKCEECDCGPNSISCEFEIVEKKCNCKENYAHKWKSGGAMCEECDCGPHSTGCHFFSSIDYRMCFCEFGYTNGLNKFGESIGCIECNCGTNSTMCYFDRDHKKKCSCDIGYVPINSITSGLTCEICDCGPNSNNCGIDKNNHISCSCKTGYHPKARSTLNKNEECVPEESGKWKLPTFIVLAVCGIIIIGVLVRIYYKKRRGY